MRKTGVILAVSFLVPFLIGGAVAWLWTGNMSDNPHAGGGGLLSDKQIADAEKQIDDEANKHFLIVGFTAGAAGFLIGAIFSRKRLK